MALVLSFEIKYNRPGPRYTSYPPVPFWTKSSDEKRWVEHIQSNYDPEKGMDLYVQESSEG